MRDIVYPRGEIAWTGYRNAAGELMFVLTSKESRDYYYLYKVVGERLEKLGRAKDPPELERRFGVRDAIYTA